MVRKRPPEAEGCKRDRPSGVRSARDASGGEGLLPPRNLKYRRAFAAAWPERRIVQEPLAQLPWYHFIALLEKLEGPAERLWYVRQAMKQGWSRAILVLQIDARAHDRQGKARTLFSATLPPGRLNASLGPIAEGRGRVVAVCDRLLFSRGRRTDHGTGNGRLVLRSQSVISKKGAPADPAPIKVTVRDLELERALLPADITILAENARLARRRAIGLTLRGTCAVSN